MRAPAGGAKGTSSVRWRGLEILALAVIAVLALYLRWENLHLAEFSYDQAWSLNRAREFLRQGSFPFHGEISSLGVPHGPVEIYLLVVPLLVSSDPLVATAFVGLLQTMAVIGTFLLCRRAFGSALVGLVAAGLYAVNPWALHFARKLWPPSVLPLFALLLLAALYLGAVERRPRWVVAAFGLAAAMAMTHPAGFVFALTTVLVAVACWRVLGLRTVGLGVLVALLVASPYLVFDAQQGFAFLRAYAGVPGSSSATTDLVSLQMAAAMASEGGLRGLLQPAFGAGYIAPALPALDWLAAVLLLAGVLLCLRRVVLAAGGWRKGQNLPWKPHLLLLVWFGLPVALTFRHSLPLNEAYFVGLWPGQFILMALAIVGGGRWLGAALQRLIAPSLTTAVVAGAVVLVLGASQVAYASARSANLLSLPPAGDGGIPLHYSKQAIAEAKRLRKELGEPPVFVFASHGQWTALDYLARPDVPLEKVEPPKHLVVPADLSRGVLAVLAANDGSGEPLGFRALADASPVISAAATVGYVDLPGSAVLGPRGYQYFRFLYLSPEKATALPSRFTRPARSLVLDNGLALVGLRYPERVAAGGSLQLLALWKMPGDPQAHPWRDFVLFAHLVDREGRPLAQADWPVFQYRTLWRADDYLVCAYDLPLPREAASGLFWLDVGAYEYYSRQQVPWLGRGGALEEGAEKLGPIRVSGAPPAPLRWSSGVSFGSSLTLETYEVTTGNVAGDTEVTAKLVWRATTKPDADYVVSLQVIDGSGRLVGQHDGPPAGGNYPTAAWEAGERVLDVHTAKFGPSRGSPPYAVALVVYDSRTQARLLANGQDHLVLARLP